MWDWSYLTSLLLPEDSRLRVSFGFTREGGSAALSHNLVPRADDKLGRSWSQRGKASVLVRKWNKKRLNIRTGDYRGGGFKQKTSNLQHGQIKMGVPYRASMQLYIHGSLSKSSEQRKNTDNYHCHGNQVGHSSRWGWGWMNDSHIGIRTGKRLGHNGTYIWDNTKAHPCPGNIQNYEQIQTYKG